MREILELISVFSILIPAIIGAYRFRITEKKYQPFILLIWVGLASEVLQTVFRSYRLVGPAYARSNIYILIEYLMYLWFFKNVSTSIKTYWLKIVLFLGLLTWFYENLFLGRLTSGYNYYYQVGYSLIIALLAIEIINEVLIKERKSLLKNGLFLISASMVTYYTFNVFIEIELHFATVGHGAFFNAIFAIQQWINCFVNLVFALAILWIPTKKNFTNPSF